ncbi:MAG: diacylglycerol/lipid kinase family protein [Luteimonas sp.]
MTDSIPIVLNARSGPDGGREDRRASIEAAFSAHGLHARFAVAGEGEDIGEAVDAVLAQGAQVVVAAGGDGTVNAVASRLLDRDTTLGVLPLGTLNHFARDLGIPDDLDGAARVIAQAHRVTTDVGEVNGRYFLNNSSLGLYPRIVSEREHAQHHLGLGKWPAMARATWHALRHPSSFDAMVRIDGDAIERRTPFIFVGNNCYVLEGFGLGRRACLDDGVLSLHVLRPKSTLGFLWLGVRSLLGIGSHDGDFDHFEADAFEIRAQRGDDEVAVDGEVACMSSPMRYRIHKRALQVYAPAPAKASG